MQALDAAAVAAWASSCVRGLDDLCADIDRINVYPVPDSDTGSNMLHTIVGAHAALEGAAVTGAGDALTVLSRGAVAAARGNSGVILAQVLRGIADSAGDAEAIDAGGLAAALGRAERTATRAVARPVDGTMLTVLREAAGAAAQVRESALADVVVAAADAAAKALALTPSQLPVLADAGVVDAGGRGLLAIIDELAALVTGEPCAMRPEFTPPAGLVLTRPAVGASAQPWEVMYLLDGMTEAALPDLRDALSELGDCVTIAGDGAGSHAVHVHCADIGAAIEAGLREGRPRAIRVESLVTATVPQTGRAVLAVVAGAALGELCRQEGITVLVVEDGTLPDRGVLERAIADAQAAHVVVLPGGVELTDFAEIAADAAVAVGRDVVVIPCASGVQVLSALAVHDPHRRAGDDVVAMAEAAAATRRGELTVAEQDAITWIGRANAGDFVGLVDDEVVLIERPSADPADAAIALIERMLSAGGELVTALVGTAAPDGVAEVLAERLAESHPVVEFVWYPGGQTSSVLAIGVE